MLWSEVRQVLNATAVHISPGLSGGFGQRIGLELVMPHGLLLCLPQGLILFHLHLQVPATSLTNDLMIHCIQTCRCPQLLSHTT